MRGESHLPRCSLLPLASEAMAILKEVKVLKFKKNIVIFLVILICMSAVIFSRPINNLDELWNFNFARNIAEGRLPYRDFNMVLTPLMPIVNAGFLGVFGIELALMRVVRSSYVLWDRVFNV